MDGMQDYQWNRWSLLVAAFIAASCQFSLAQTHLGFTLGRNTQGEDTVAFKWQAEPDTVLQRSSTLSDNRWETLFSTRGEAEFTDLRQPVGTMFYRLVQLPDANSLETTPTALEWRLTEMTINQIDRAVNPQPMSEDLLLPSDDEDGPHSLSEFGKLERFTWASQPGLIRIFTPEKGRFDRAYKLYSSKDSIASSHEELQADIAQTRSWKRHPDRFTDLNEPISDGSGNKQFPILDPRALSLGVEGFDYFDDTALGTASNKALPMPAEWLYALKDGSLGTLDDDGHWNGASEASETNPIVARLAYWGDDETTKLNVNIASEARPWDVPRADTPKERSYALMQPVNGEVQRYPGHPSMTSLSSLLFPGKSANHDHESKRLTETELKLIYDLTPRVVYNEIRRNSTPLTLDDDANFRSVNEWLNKATSHGIDDAEVLRGFVTTSNPAPEITVHGLPRISMWPVHESTSHLNRSPYDTQSATLSQSYNFLRRDANSRHGEFYVRANRHNVDLFQYLMHQAYLKTPGYGKSLAAKYGARLAASNYGDDTDYDKDHFMIAVSMLDHIRTTNIFDPNQGEPYVDPVFSRGSGPGMIPGISLISRDLKTGNGSSDHAERWSQPTLEPSASGRDYTLSELVLTAYVTSETTIDSWTKGQPTFRRDSGPGADVQVLKRTLENKHPAYAEWTSHTFGPNDVGKTFVSIEVGLVPEAFSPSQGSPRKIPSQTLRLLTGGSGYRGGFSSSRGLRVNGVPLQLWGESAPNNTPQRGPIVSSTERPEFTNLENSIPRDWPSHGGLGGPRLFVFGTFTIGEDQEGWFGRDFLPNGSGPFAAWYCQTPVVVEKGTSLSFTQDEPIQIALYAGNSDSATTGNLQRLFNFRFAQPGKAFEVPPPVEGSTAYRGWTRRFRIAKDSSANDPTPITEPRNTEVTKGLSVAHGDYRHVALKRVVPSELFGHHPSAKTRRNSHSLTWATRGGAFAEPSATQGPAETGRSMVRGVTYADDVLPDFVYDPRNRAKFAPLLSSNYRFPIDPTITRDFDNGLGNAPDGPYINTSDDGEDKIQESSVFNSLAPYFEGTSSIIDTFGHEHHFARRMAPSPVAFGSLPSASQANAPWTCLLFRPNLFDPTSSPHLGEAGNGMMWERNRTTLDGFEVPQMASVTGDPTYPADHLWLDYFWMPTAQPVDAGSPFATQGKVNMNYQLFPYTYIKRATAMHAVLKGEEIMAIPTSAGLTYKTSKDNPNWRHRIDATETLTQFEIKFGKGEIFMTESEICEQFLIPEGQAWDGTGTSIRTFWGAHRLSGDNTLERPYAGLYSRLTTRSNAFRLHFRIQAIAKGPGSAPDRFDRSHDTIPEDRRGAKVIERVLDHEALPNYLNRESDVASMPRAEAFYRVVVRDAE